MENNEKGFLEFKISYEVEKIMNNHKNIEYHELTPAMKLSKLGHLCVLETLFSCDDMEMKIVKPGGNKLTLEEEETIKKALHRYIALFTVVKNQKKDEEKLQSGFIALKDTLQPAEDFSCSILFMLLLVKINFPTGNDIYRIKEMKTKEKLETEKARVINPKQLIYLMYSMANETITYSVDIISINELRSQKEAIGFFLNLINCWNEYTLFLINPVFQIKDICIDKEEMCDLKSLYEEIWLGTKLVDYGLEYASKRISIMSNLVEYEKHKALDDLVNLLRENRLVADKKDLKILMSIKNNESDIKLERKVTESYTNLLLIVNLLCKTVDPECIDLLGLRNISTIEDLYDMCNCAHAGLNKIESNLIESRDLLKENKELSRNKIEKNIEAVQAAIKQFDTWKIEEEEIKKLHSFQIEYIMEKLRKRNFIKYPWDHSNESETSWFSVNYSRILILLKFLFVIIGIVIFLYKQNRAGHIDASNLK